MTRPTQQDAFKNECRSSISGIIGGLMVMFHSRDRYIWWVERIVSMQHSFVVVDLEFLVRAGGVPENHNFLGTPEFAGLISGLINTIHRHYQNKDIVLVTLDGVVAISSSNRLTTEDLACKLKDLLIGD